MSINNEPENPREKAMFANIEKYLSSDMTQKQFCIQEKLAYSTFQKWLQLYRKSHVESAPNPSQKKFIPVEIAPQQQIVSKNSQCVIEYPNGIIIRFKGKFDSQLIQSLIQNR